jgi:hypothetical protein
VALELNHGCDTAWPRRTLASLRTELLTRAGFAAQLVAGIEPEAEYTLAGYFLREAQELLYQRYDIFRVKRWFSWSLLTGVRHYDFTGNDDACDKLLNPNRIRWVGISQGDETWRELVQGIDPRGYGDGRDSIPQFYEIGQGFEVWPAPSDDTWTLRVQGDFGLEPFEADDDQTTVDPRAVFLLALANYKADKGQADAGNYMGQMQTYVGDLQAAAHGTRRYIPGTAVARNAVRPVLVE